MPASISNSFANYHFYIPAQLWKMNNGKLENKKYKNNWQYGGEELTKKPVFPGNNMEGYIGFDTTSGDGLQVLGLNGNFSVNAQVSLNDPDNIDPCK